MKSLETKSIKYKRYIEGILKVYISFVLKLCNDNETDKLIKLKLKKKN